MHPTTQRGDWAGRAGTSSPLAAIPSWIISLALHAILLFAIASSLKSCEGLPTGDPGAGERVLGLHVKDANSLVDRPTDDSESTESAAKFQQPLDNDVQQPLLDDQPPTRLQTPRLQRPAEIIGAGGPPAAGALSRPLQNMIRPNGDFQPKRPGALNKGETSFFGIRDSATQFTYVLDASGSMAGTAILAAKSELKKSIEALDATQQFQILFYTQTPRIMKLPNVAADALVWATAINKTLARQDISSVVTSGGTNHMPALKKALRLNPEVIYFLTDADEPILGARDLNEIKQLNRGRARIHCIEFGKGPDLKIENFLGRLARQNGGTYRYRNILKFERR